MVKRLGYRWCHDNENCYGPICTYSELCWQFEDDNGDMWDHYPVAVGNLYIRTKAYGSAIGATTVRIYGPYIFYNAPSWDSIWSKVSANASGCSVSGYDLKVDGRVKIANLGETFTKCVAVITLCWATDGNYWCWTGTGSGFIGSGNCVNIKVGALRKITGYVKSEFLNTPLPFAKITFGSKSAFTNTNGYYEILEPDFISGPIKCEVDGYETQSKMITSPETGELVVNFMMKTVQMGDYECYSTPTGADVYLNGILKGKTNLTLKGLSSGNYQVLLKLTGYKDETFPITIVAGETTMTSTILTPIEPEPTLLNVISTPSGAYIWIDDLPTFYITPFEIGITPGSHKLRIEKEGYITQEKTVNCIAKKITSVEFILELSPYPKEICG